MSKSVCVRCDGTRFEAVTETPEKSNFKLTFIRCVNCRGVIGITDFFNAEAMVRRLAKALKVKLE